MAARKTSKHDAPAAPDSVSTLAEHFLPKLWGLHNFFRAIQRLNIYEEVKDFQLDALANHGATLAEKMAITVEEVSTVPDRPNREVAHG